MGAARQGGERPARLPGVGGLAVDAAVERDDGVDAQDGQAAAVGGGDLAAGVLERDRLGVAVLELLDVRGPDVERDAELLEDRPPLGRLRG